MSSDFDQAILRIDVLEKQVAFLHQRLSKQEHYIAALLAKLDMTYAPLWGKGAAVKPKAKDEA
jgi:hypothetical protein